MDGLLYDVTVDGGTTPKALNDVRQVVGFDFRLSLGASPSDPFLIEFFGDTHGIKDIRSINNSGFFPGLTSRKFRGKNVFSAIRYTNSIEVLQQDDSASTGINAATATSDGDVIGQINVQKWRVSLHGRTWLLRPG